VYWGFSGSGITAEDFTSGGLTGSLTLGTDGRATFSRAINLDYSPEGDEILTVSFFSDPSRSSASSLGSTQITLRDVALSGVGGATDGRDVIIGTSGDEIISGVPAGSSLYGSRSIDVLTGNGGNDLFVLGDASAVYYNDGTTASPGGSDLAVITDFSAGDRVQLRGGPTDYRLASGKVMGYNGVSLYWTGPGSGYNVPGGLSAASGELIGHLRLASLANLSLFDSTRFIYV
jgi:hypothetical protein